MGNNLRFRAWFGILTALILWSLPSPVQAAYKVGVARADITPEGPIWMAGYGSRNKPSVGVDQGLQAKVLVLQHDEDAPLLLITADIIGFSREIAEDIVGKIQQTHRIPRENVLLVGSHTHSGPVIGLNLKGMFDLKGEEAERVQKYTQGLVSRIVQAGGEALRKMEPAQLSFGRGKATFAANRRVFRGNGVGFGVNPDGPVDHQVPVLRIDDDKGKVKAIVFGYACHCTTLNPNDYKIDADWAGYAQDYLERANPGATVLFVTGCGGDANPEPRLKSEHARQHGLEIAGAVEPGADGLAHPGLGEGQGRPGARGPAPGQTADPRGLREKAPGPQRLRPAARPPAPGHAGARREDHDQLSLSGPGLALRQGPDPGGHRRRGRGRLRAASQARVQGGTQPVDGGLRQRRLRLRALDAHPDRGRLRGGLQPHLLRIAGALQQ